jgi:hypothetical protein
MNLYELGKEMQALLTLASSIDRKLSDAASTAPKPGTVEPVPAFTTDFPCVPDPVFDDFDNNSFNTALHAFTLISNAARGDDYVVATVSNQDLVDRNNNSLGNNLFLVRQPLQCMVELADSLNEALGAAQGTVDVLYGTYNYRRGPNPVGIIPVAFGVRAQWVPNAGDFNAAGAGLLISLGAKLVQSGSSCGLWIRAKMQQSFGGQVTEFRAGSSYTQEKLNTLAVAYYRARVRKKGFEEINLNGDVVTRMQLAE